MIQKIIYIKVPVCKFHVISFSWFVQYAMMPVVTTKCLVYLNQKKKKVLVLDPVLEHGVMHVDWQDGTVH